MAEQITWTHVDKLVRKMHDDHGMLAVGLTDAEVAYAFIKFLGRNLNQAEVSSDSRGATIASLQRQLKEAQAVKPGKTKQRLAKLEEEVARLSAALNNCPALPFTIGKCANKYCINSAREISPYCEKCEPDL